MATTPKSAPEPEAAKSLGEYTVEELNAADTSFVDGDQWNKRDGIETAAAPAPEEAPK